MKVTTMKKVYMELSADEARKLMAILDVAGNQPEDAGTLNFRVSIINALDDTVDDIEGK